MASEPYTASERALPREAAAILHRSHWLYEERAPEERLSRTASARERAQASSTRIVRASCDAYPAVARGSAHAGPPAPAAQPRGTRVSRRLAALAVLGAEVACVTVTLIERRPRHLPGVVLGSPVLLR